MLQLTLYALIAGLFSLVGGLLLIWKSNYAAKVITPLLSFSAGAFIGVAFLDILPEAVEMVEEPHAIFLAFLVGFTAFFIIERVLMRYFHYHTEGEAGEHGEHTESLPLLIITGDSLHNFLDGIVIALAYVANPALGLTTAIAIAAHEIPQEIGDFSILLDQGWKKLNIIMVNILSSLLTVVGVFIGFYAAGFFENRLAFLLAAASGIFTYIAASDIIPEIHHRAGHKELYRVVFAFILGLIVIGYLVSVSH
ncbi:MAG: ZIP family metal transporter [bacterium]|nr:ZIP family metal transporter [bacterium]